jgi:hypothetical protein
VTDIASLSFNIDTSNVPPATNDLDRLSDSAEKVRASTRFLVSDFSNTNDALQQLATSGRASLASFVAISQDLDGITARLGAMRQAAADTIGTLGGSNMSAALTTFQQQFATMATLFGTSAAQLEAFNKQAEYLGMNSYQVTAALQRITQAQQNMTPAGAAIRQALNQEGISTNQDASQIIQQAQSYYAGHAQSQQAYDTLQLLLGPQDPATATALRYQGYRTIASRRQEFIAQTLDQQGAQTGQVASDIEYRNRYNRDAYNDGSQYLSYRAQTDLDGSGRNAFIQAITRQIAADQKSNPGNVSQEQQMLATLQAAQAGSQNAISAESQFAIMNPNNPLARSALTSYGRRELLSNPLSGQPSWYDRFTDSSYQANNRNYIGAAYDDARANVGPGFLGIPGFLRDTALNTDETTASIANRLGLYTGPSGSGTQSAGFFSRLFGAPGLPGGAGPKPIGAVENAALYRQDANTAAQFGYGGFNDVAGAIDALAQLQSTGPGSDLSRLQQLFGNPEGSAIIGQQIGAASYTAANAARPGFDQLQQLNTAGFLGRQMGGQDIASALVSFAQGQGVQTGRWLGSGLSLDQIMGGQGAAGAALTPGQVQAFQQIIGQLNNNGLTSQQAQFGPANAAATTQLGLAGSLSGGDYQANVAGLEAYDESVKKTNDSLQNLKAFQDAVTLAFKQQAIAGAEATTTLRNLNDVQDKAIQRLGLALGTGQPGAYGAASAENDIQAQLQAYKTANGTAGLASYEAQIRRQQQNGIIGGAQDTLSGLQNQAFAQSATLSGFGNSDARNRAQTELEFASQLQSATGDTKTALDQMIDSIVSAKDNLDGLNQRLSDLQGAISGYTQGSGAAAALAAPPGQQAAVQAGFTAKAAVLGSNDPLSMLSPAARAALSPWLPQIQAAVSANGLPPQATSIIGADMGYESSGIPGIVGADPYSADGKAVGLGQFDLQTARSFGLAGNGFDNRTNPQRSIAAMVKYWGQLVQRHGGNWNDPNTILAAAGSYGTIPQGMTTDGLGTGDLAASGAIYNVNENQLLQARNIGLGTQTASATLAAQLPYLRNGATGSASLAAARVVNPLVPDLEKPETQSAQLAQASDSLARGAAALEAENNRQILNDATLTRANLQGPGAVRLANAQISAYGSALQFGQQDNPAYLQNETNENMNVSAAEFGKAAAAQYYQRAQQLSLQQTENGMNLFAGPYQRTLNDAAAQQAQQDKIDTANGVSPQQIAQNDALSQQSAALDVIVQKQQVVAQGMGQIGDAVGSTLQNVAFSYQHGPGAGVYDRQQLSGLFNTASRSLFNTVVGDPISNFVSGNLSGLVDTILGITPGSANGSGSNSGGNGTGTAASQTLGGLGGILQNVGGNQLLSSAFKGIGSLLGIGGAGSAASAFTSAPGAIADELGATTNPGLFSSLGSGIGSFFSGIGSLFATGALIDRGQRYPFATGGVFGAGPRWGFASGDVFTDPTTMPMATIGEAGPEAVMPLRRGADGRLGIATSGGGNGGPQIVVNAPISVGQNALQNNGQMSQKQIVDLQRQLGTAVRRSVQTEIANQTRPGGMVQPQA